VHILQDLLLEFAEMMSKDPEHIVTPSAFRAKSGVRVRHFMSYNIVAELRDKQGGCDVTTQQNLDPEEVAILHLDQEGDGSSSKAMHSSRLGFDQELT
jgi:hypothetical protein